MTMMMMMMLEIDFVVFVDSVSWMKCNCKMFRMPSTFD